MVSLITLQFYFDFNKWIKKYHKTENAVNWLHFCFLGVSLYLHSDALGYGIIENECHLQLVICHQAQFLFWKGKL